MLRMSYDVFTNAIVFPVSHLYHTDCVSIALFLSKLIR